MLMFKSKNIKISFQIIISQIGQKNKSWLKKDKDAAPRTCVIEDLDSVETTGTFYKQVLQYKSIRA